MKKRTWQLYLMTLLLASALLAVTAMAKEPERKAAPAAVFPEKTYQFKPVLEGTVVTHVFKVQNKGTADLLIQRVKPG